MQQKIDAPAMLEDEQESAYLYGILSELEAQPKLAELYQRLAAAETRHAQFWQNELIGEQQPLKAYRPSLRIKFMVWMARRFGANSILPMLGSAESRSSSAYQSVSMDMAAEERSHSTLLGQMQKISKGAGLPGPAVARLEGRHRSAGGNALRAAVLGASDGLVSNFNLIMGVAGADLATSQILLTGGAGLLAGAISMALGEWISVQSSRELYERQIAIEKAEIAATPEDEVEELVLIYEARGLDSATALAAAQGIMNNPDTAIDALSREELGIDPDDLGGSAFTAAITSFALFGVGAIIPLIPYLFLDGWTATVCSAAASGLGLFGTGALISFFTGQSILRNGLRQTLFGLAAAAATYLIGKAVGVSLMG